MQGQRAQVRWVTRSSAGRKEGNPVATADLGGGVPSLGNQVPEGPAPQGRGDPGWER